MNSKEEQIRETGIMMANVMRAQGVDPEVAFHVYIRSAGAMAAIIGVPKEELQSTHFATISQEYDRAQSQAK